MPTGANAAPKKQLSQDDAATVLQARARGRAGRKRGAKVASNLTVTRVVAGRALLRQKTKTLMIVNTSVRPRQWAGRRGLASTLLGATLRGTNEYGFKALTWRARRSAEDAELWAEIDKRRATVLRIAPAAVDDEEDGEIDEEYEQKRQRCALRTVSKVMAKKEDEDALTHPLKRFVGVAVTVMLVHHVWDEKAKHETITRRLVAMDSALKWERFNDWACGCLGLKESDAEGLAYLYKGLSGVSHAIDRKSTFSGWLDTMWCVYPLVCHVFASSHLAARAGDTTSEVEDIFRSYDKDRSGTISMAELHAVVSEMGLEDLGVSSQDVQAFVQLRFAEVDSDTSGVIEYAEFEAFYNVLQEFVKDRVTMAAKYKMVRARPAHALLTPCSRPAHALLTRVHARPFG